MAPWESLLIASSCLAALWLLFRPRAGYFWRLRRFFINNERVLIEDALKHIYDCEYRKHACTLPSIAGMLGVRGEKVTDLAARLEALGLVVSSGGQVTLTDEGRSYALRVIRVHRIWERYLAERTGVPEQDWHRDAEQQEHRLSMAEANALAAQLGNPSFDPHGDPIPTTSGELPPPRGIALTDLPPGERAEIVHVEDEPEAIYAQLAALGLHPGMKVEVIESNAERIRFIADGEEVVLAPVFAANLTVHKLETAEEVSEHFHRLSELKPGQFAKVIGIARSCRGMQRRRLMDLGLIPGTTVSAELRGAGGDPTAYQIRGAIIALRKEQADHIYIQPMENQEA